MKKISNLLLCALIPVTLAGCSFNKSEPSFAQEIQGKSAAYASIAKEWEQGDALIARAEKLNKEGRSDVRKGEKLVSAGQDKIKKARSMANKGEQMKNAAEQNYQTRASAAPIMTAP